jgi:hypothetical protein
MTQTQSLHLAGFRQACRSAGIPLCVGDVAFTGTKGQRPPRVTKLDPNAGDNAPVVFTAALDDFGDFGLPVQGNHVETATHGYRITGVRIVEPLVHFDCAEGVPL